MSPFGPVVRRWRCRIHMHVEYEGYVDAHSEDEAKERARDKWQNGEVVGEWVQTIDGFVVDADVADE